MDHIIDKFVKSLVGPKVAQEHDIAQALFIFNMSYHQYYQLREDIQKLICSYTNPTHL